ncbi:MAG: YjiH family protein [Spirochaetaceae bacterium]|jgi:nucleoside recognition membrane protein YjiH|nr:YjiH family protein [Spirochaetaceae bacterium]
MSDSNKNQSVLRFIIPSLIGVALFMLPIPYEGGLSILLAVLVKTVNGVISPALPHIAFVVALTSGLLTLLVKIFRPAFVKNNNNLKGLFDVPWVWAVLRAIGAAFAAMVYFKFGPEQITSDATGTFILYDLVSPIMTTVVFAGGLLPLLLEFGLLEFVGTFLSVIFRKIFTLPGRAAVDCVTSWLGDAQVAVLLTANQYEHGYYSEREAVVIATTFSAVSIAFSLVVIEQVKMGNMFIPFYLTVCLVGVICAIILPRIPPLSLRKDRYYTGTGGAGEGDIPAGYSLPRWAVKRAIEKANSGYTLKKFGNESVKTVFSVIFSLTPVIMAIATCALMVSEYTPILGWLGKPFLPLLKLLGLPEAEIASKTMVVGFTDMFIPSVIASAEVTSQLTRFVIATVSITQLLYMSENGAMILSSKIPANIGEMFLIFLERTIVSIIATTLIARFILHLV